MIIAVIINDNTRFRWTIGNEMLEKCTIAVQCFCEAVAHWVAGLKEILANSR